jgi:ATP-dependent helicase/nuclease subunit A
MTSVMAELAIPVLADQMAREEALDTDCSVLVQAPAGSGKTELLAMRFLKLLAEVDEPEQVLGITFGNAATAEIRHRIVGKLDKAKRVLENEANPDGKDSLSLQIATAAYINSIERGWRLLEQPQRLNIQTIDSLCLRIAHRMPLSQGPGGMLQPTEDARAFYRRAARKTFDRLGGNDAELNDSLKALLQLRDSNLRGCEKLLADMFETRDQWTSAFPLTGEIDWEQARGRLEEPFHREIRPVLGEAHRLLSSHTALTRELLELAKYACNGEGLKIEIRLLAGLTTLPSPSPESVEHWQCFCELLLTKDDGPRKTFNANNGFPPADDGQKRRMEELARDLVAIPELVDLLVKIRALPPPRYSDKQWESLRHIFVALRHAVDELRAVFVQRGTIDFIEVGMAALHVLNGEGSGGQSIQHLLVDEFQDTSRSQHRLIGALLRDWRADSGRGYRRTLFDRPRTLFFVGDPMQSIYMFRQADVELFDLVRDHGFATGNQVLPLKTLQLTTNFRSNAGVVKPLNAIFATIFPYGAKPGAAAVDFLPGSPANAQEPQGAYEIHASFLSPKKKNSDTELPSDDADAGQERDTWQKETGEIVKIVQAYRPRIERALLQDEEFTVAVLARAKNHLIPIAAALRQAEIPFRAIELETLNQRQEILDLQSLTRALLHPMDRVAWLALLRAPWCGLALRDLHLLCGTDERQSGRGSVLQEINDHRHLLGDESKVRVNRVIAVLQAALANRHRQSSFRSWIERTWNSLGGPDCVDAAGYENAREYFRMLEQVSPDGIAATGEAMNDRLNRLFASADPSLSDRCGVQLMTMHKAKGLGFNVVVLPGLHRIARTYSQTLIRYLERATEAGAELLVAPIDDTGAGASPLNKWVRQQRENRETEERKRLLYVACTRARDELHLFATAEVTNRGLVPKSGSLLHTAWPALEEVFQAGYVELNASQVNNLVEFPSPSPVEEPVDGVLETVAAESPGSILRRLPSGWAPTPVAPNISWRTQKAATVAIEDADQGQRPQGSRTSRILGTTVHTLFERAARLFNQGQAEAGLRSVLPQFRAQAAALTRNEGLSPQEVASIARKAVQALEMALADTVGLWILSPHHEAQTESSWTGVIDGVPRTLRIDRSFRAGPEPLSEGESCLWVIDYKTATHGPSGIAEFLEVEKLQYMEQLQSYAEIIRLLHGDEMQLRLGLYYPFLARLVWWLG